MRRDDSGDLHLGPTDLTTFTACVHASRLQVDRALGRPTPDRGRDPDADVLAELGRRHEDAYLDALRGRGLRVERLEPFAADAEVRVRELMHAGVDVIAQAPLRAGPWGGVADVLRRRELPSVLGDHCYEVEDTKLAMSTRAGTVLQLLVYARLLEGLQGTPGEFVHVVTPDAVAGAFRVESLRVDDFDAVTDLARSRFEAFLGGAEAGTAVTAPEPVEHCAVCLWWGSCRGVWRDADHLSLVAHLGGAHRAELERRGVRTRGALAALRGGLGFRPEYGRSEAYLDAAHQADVQVRSEVTGELIAERLPVEEGRGLRRLPESSPHDVYVDLEGTPFVPGGGLEYLWGWSVGDGPVTKVWALDRTGEKRAFERFVDEVASHLAAHPEAHVLHFGSYEPSAFKRLMGRHATREEELDALLRREAFVDLLQVSRQGFRIGVETYSLKDLERLHGYVRDEDLRTLGPQKRAVEHALLLGAPDAAPADAREAVARYNADDVRSTVALHRWLEAQRVAQGIRARPAPEDDGAPSEELSEQRARVQALVDALQAGVAAEPEARTAKEAARVLLANLLDFERREAKVAYWTKFAHLEMTPEELEASTKGIAGLRAVEVIAPVGRQRAPRVRYTFPAQDIDVRSRERFHARVGDEVRSFAAELDLDARTLTVTQGGGTEDARFREGFFWNLVEAKAITETRLELAQVVLERGLEETGRYRAARDLLLARACRMADGAGAARVPGEDPLAAAKRLALGLRGGVLPVQGPPGSGKTYVGARVIVELVRAGRAVAVTAVAHKAITNMLAEVVKAAAQANAGPTVLGGLAAPVDVRVGHMGGAEDLPAGVRPYREYESLRSDLGMGAVNVVGGTAWVWTRPEFREAVDTVVIDEAGQFSLAMALSVATAGRDLILLGDPQQLTQPIQGAHPDGAEISALEHLLQGHKTLPEGQGLFLDRTYRMHPNLTRYVSRSFYEDRLESMPDTAHVTLAGTDGFDGAGVSYLPVEHEGRDGTAYEEVVAVQAVVRRLVRPGARFTDREGVTRPLRAEDVLVIAPFNRHVDALARGLGAGPRVGTVDKLQGQEAPVVVYTLGVSSQDLAPRGIEFLFDLHRINVAVSRAQARAVVVASPRLFEEVPGTVSGLRLVNAHVRLVGLG